MSDLAPLPHPVYFVSKSQQLWADLMRSRQVPSVESAYDRFCSSHDAWCVQTYIQLRQRGLDVYLVPRYLPGRICVTSYEHLAVRDLPFRSYVVVCRHDRGRPEICEQRIVQNPLNLVDWTDHLLPLWPQPNLQPRSPDRGTRLEILGFKGRNQYIAAPFRDPAFLRQLAQLGVAFKPSPDAEADYRRAWTDYSQTDAILAVRDCTEYDLALKPPSKLVNAWFAGCPALLGPEPAYRSLRQSDLDYFEVRSPADALAVVRLLRDRPDRYTATVENGRRRAREFAPDVLAQRWRDLLAGPIAAGYDRWRQTNWLGRAARFAQFGHRAIAHQRERQAFARNIRHGRRLFDSEVMS